MSFRLFLLGGLESLDFLFEGRNLGLRRAGDTERDDSKDKSKDVHS